MGTKRVVCKSQFQHSRHLRQVVCRHDTLYKMPLNEIPGDKMPLYDIAEGKMT
jgi:hypothetical protein